MKKRVFFWLIFCPLAVAALALLLPPSPFYFEKYLHGRGRYEGQPTRHWVKALDSEDLEQRNQALFALELDREHFRSSDQLDRPYAMVGVTVFAADTDQEARRLFTSLQQQFLNLIRGVPDKTPPPVETMDGLWSPAEQAHVDHMTRYAVVGAPATIRRGLETILEDSAADEIIATGSAFDHAARLHSFEIAAEVFKGINEGRRSEQLVATSGKP